MEMSRYTDEEKDLAEALVKSLPKELVEKERLNIGCGDENSYIHDGVIPNELASSYSVTGSSDIGDVSWIMPFSTIFTATWPIGVNAHTWQAASASGSTLGQKGMLYASKIMAGMFYDIVNDSNIIESAKTEFEKRTVGKPYDCPIK
jgi:aminobenzoyl-glutamate utilization protein B